jgi:dodecin
MGVGDRSAAPQRGAAPLGSNISHTAAVQGRMTGPIEEIHIVAAKNSKGGVYRVTELVGTSPTSWEDAARNAVETAGKTLRGLRIAEISKLDIKVEGGKVVAYRARLTLSFKYEA